MTHHEFEKVYEASRSRAVKVIVEKGYPRAVAEDAVQLAAVYFLERLSAYARITTSLFIQQAVRRARDVYEAAYGSVRAKGKAALVVSVGSTADLVDFETTRPVCTTESD